MLKWTWGCMYVFKQPPLKLESFGIKVYIYVSGSLSWISVKTVFTPTLSAFWKFVSFNGLYLIHQFAATFDRLHTTTLLSSASWHHLSNIFKQQQKMRLHSYWNLNICGAAVSTDFPRLAVFPWAQVKMAVS